VRFDDADDPRVAGPARESVGDVLVPPSRLIRTGGGAYAPGNLHAFAACLNVGDCGLIVLGIAMTAPRRPNTKLEPAGLEGSELTGSGKPVTPCARMHCDR
jgi:hypothetical protein